jgi:hypothetical protein
MRTTLLIAFVAFLSLVSSLPAADEPAKEEGFKSLFDGKTLEGWKAAGDSYIVKDGAIVCNPQGKGGGNLYTNDEYADFDLKFEFKLTPGANNGIGIRTPPSGDAAYVGMEIQVLDDSAKKYENLAPYQYHGSVYGLVPAKRGHQKPVGEWNSEEIILKGKKIQVILNGTTIVDADLAEVSTPAAVEKHPGLKREKGYICFCGHGDVVEFRNLRIKELK